MNFVEVFGIIFAVAFVIAFVLIIWITNETSVNKQSRREQYQRQDWLSARHAQQQRARAEYLKNFHDKVDASRRSHKSVAA